MQVSITRKSFARLGFVTAFLVLTVVGISVTLAQQLPFSDGRINQISFFGGDAFYCVDKEYRVTMELPDVANGGGFRLLNMTGQHLWYIPGADVTTALDQLTGISGPVLVARGQGTYGATSLYVNKDANNQNMYIYMGYDNYNKPNSFIFGSCIPQGAPADFSLTPSSVPIVPTNTPIVGASATAVPSSTLGGPSATPSQTLTPSLTFTASETLTPSMTFTATDTLTPTNTFTATDTLTPTNTATDVPPTATFTATNTATEVPPTATFTATNTATEVPPIP